MCFDFMMAIAVQIAHQPDESDAGIGFARHRYHVFPEWTLSLRVAETLVVVKSLVVVPPKMLVGMNLPLACHWSQQKTDLPRRLIFESQSE